MAGIFREIFLKTMGLMLILGLFIGEGSVGSPIKSYAEWLLSTSHGLDLSKLHLVVDAPPEYDEELYERAFGHLNQAGLSIKSYFTNTYKPREPLFRFTFVVESVDELCPNFFGIPKS